MEGKWRKSAQLEIWVDDDTMLFVAVGEIDFAYYEGDKKISSPKKGFEIRGCNLDGIFSEDELKTAAATIEDFTVTLTDSEKETQKKAMERRAAEKADTEKEAKANAHKALSKWGSPF